MASVGVLPFGAEQKCDEKWLWRLRGEPSGANLFILASLESCGRGFCGRFAVWGQNRSAVRSGFGGCVGNFPQQTCSALQVCNPA